MIFWLIYILLEAVIQFKLISKGNKPNYLQLFIIRGMAAILFGGIVMNVTNWQDGFILLGWQICSFYVLFDIILNCLRKKKWNYKGKESGWLDSLSYPIYYTIKLLTLIFAIIFYLKGLQYWII